MPRLAVQWLGLSRVLAVQNAFCYTHRPQAGTTQTKPAVSFTQFLHNFYSGYALFFEPVLVRYNRYGWLVWHTMNTANNINN